jgi:hypothetical protein
MAASPLSDDDLAALGPERDRMARLRPGPPIPADRGRRARTWRPRTRDVIPKDRITSGGSGQVLKSGRMLQPGNLPLVTGSVGGPGVRLALMLNRAAGLPNPALVRAAPDPHLTVDTPTRGRWPCRDGTIDRPFGPGPGVIPVRDGDLDHHPGRDAIRPGSPGTERRA